MSERVVPGLMDGLITLGASGALWGELTAGSAVPTTFGACTRAPAHAEAGYVLLGAEVVATVRAGGGWSVAEADVRRAAEELNAVAMDRQDVVRVGPFHWAQGQGSPEETPLRWRRRIAEELGEPAGPGRAARRRGGPPHHLAGIDWRQLLVEQGGGGARRTWWLPRAAVRLLDAAEHAEARWLHSAGRARPVSTHLTVPPPHPRQASEADGRHMTAPQSRDAEPRPYKGELEDQLYAVLSRRPGTSRQVAGWMCAVCRTAPATVLDHCHEHGYVRAPLCTSCNTQERPDHLYGNDIRVAGRYERLFATGTDDWFRHWHRCTGCRARVTLPLPHLAAWTARIACRSLRPTHRASGGRAPCGSLRVSWTGSQNAPRSCLLTVAVDFCPSGEHRLLAQVPYREAVERFRTWLVETAPAVAAAAGPDRLDGLPARPRPVIEDTSGEGLALF
ncbi:endonuclease domain-containing protein [Streptomyces melanogenes]|uniref:endonuclease domain-containing protein n=1 Tax=Streptomyces melanogenes TaxID=67326 RepID=UPI00167CA457|nr:endonuclease domain-containing protein [Streptomyces melanogenes]GGP90777.1 hypothetical protein GCM10010278_81390 [Streptomyces melanogenes]